MKISEYPFSKEAVEYVRGAGLSLESLLESPFHQFVRIRAVERVLGAISGDIPAGRVSGVSERLAETAELFSYPLARIILSCLGDDLLIRRYAVAEAKLAHNRMQRDKDDILALAADLGFDPRGTEPWKLHFTEYVQAAHRMRSPKWKLVNRDLLDGYLTVTREELTRLMEEMVRDRVLKGLPLDVGLDTCQKLEEYILAIRSELEAFKAETRVDLGKVTESAFPPCIKRMLEQVAANVNLAHSARFALTSFLLQINMSPDQVTGLFNTSPDFDQERTRYQVEHIAGSSGTKYKPPSCATMATYGNCPGEDDLCRQIRHPLSYYERRIKQTGKG
ncbi:DNA primase large subunit PriL [uncultured archaeon]|nr:DNA primase large subunit PriL [uncultured archaeon]